MTHLVEHLEQYLGPISQGWSKDADGHLAHAQVIKFDDLATHTETETPS
jgi:hypothetical protein